MENKNLTAVEWLEERIQSDMTFMEVLGLIRQAKEIEKEQQFRFFIAGQLSMEEGGKDFEQYYDKTYVGSPATTFPNTQNK